MKIKKLFNFQKKNILITGSNGQIGKSLVKLFLENGAYVYGIDKKIVKKNQKKNFTQIELDITDKNKCFNEILNIVSKKKKIDVIINNAAASFFSDNNFLLEDEIKKTIDVNLNGLINIIKSYFLIHKKKKLNKCKIINIGSIYGIRSPDFRVYGKNDRKNSDIYGATKAAIIQLTRYYSVLYAKHNISLNCISPGGVFNHQNVNFVKKYSNRVPVGRMAKVEDLFTTVLFLSSEESSYILGQNIVLDGGLSIW
jgi:NAD(P)-dependent dehydrogenase (short-subunit alcohol dehydrogenase family)